MLRITPRIALPHGEVGERFVPLGAAHSRNRVREVSGVELRLDVMSASLPEEVKTRLLAPPIATASPMRLADTVAAPRLLCVDDWIRLIRAEYLEMPGLHLTRPQIRRLWNLDPSVCDSLVETLVSTRFLRTTSHGAYVLNRRR
jgi:hypothetical protein